MWVAAKDSVDGALKFIAQSSINALGDLSMQGVISAGGKVVVKADDATGGDLSGTYPATLTVTKIQGYAVQAHAPLNGETLIWVAGNNRYEPGVSAGTGIPDPATKVANDILQYTGAVWDAVGAAVGDPVVGPLYTGALTLVGAVNQLWNTDGGGNIGAVGATRPDKVYAKTSLWQGANQVLDTGMTLAGDVSGGYGTNTVDKIKNVAVLAGVPSDRQMFTYDSGGTRWEAQWPGMTNFSENRTFTILPTGSTVATINTALTDYDVVYLEAGTYTMGGTPIAIPSGKALIGLGDSSWGGTGGVYINGSAGATGANFITMNNGYLSNVTCYAAAAQAHDIISGNTTDFANYVERVNVSTVAANNLCAAFIGGFVKIDTFRTSNINGVYFNKTSYSLYGPSLFTNFFIDSAPTYGFYLLNSFVDINNGYVYGNAKATDYGIYYNNANGYSNHYISNIRFVQCVTGIYYNYTTNRSWRVFITNCDADGCTTGFYILGAAQFSMANCSALNCSQRGFYFQDVYYGKISDCDGLTCNGTAGITNGSFSANGCYDCTWSNLVSYNASSTNSGFYLVNSARCTVSGFSSESDCYGFVADNCHDCSFSTVTVFDSIQYGVYLSSVTRSTLVGAYVYSPGGFGTYISSCIYLAVSDVSVTEGANYGVFIESCTLSSFSNVVVWSMASYGIVVRGATYTVFANLGAHNCTGHGIVLGLTTACSCCTFVGLAASNNRGAAYIGVYIVTATYCNFSSINTCNNQGYGLYIDTIAHCSLSDIVSYGDDVYGIYTLTSVTYCTFSGGSIYIAGSYGVYLNNFQYSIFTGFNEDSSSGAYGFYFSTPLRSMFTNNKSTNHAAGGNYGFYFLNNGTGYNQFHGNTCSNCANLWPSGGGYGNWLYDDNYNLN